MPAKLLLVAALGCLASAEAVQAAPVITSIGGQVAAGQHLTILGTGFGAKPVAPPKKWDTFENGADGATLKSVDATWQDYKLDGGLRHSATALKSADATWQTSADLCAHRLTIS